MQSQNQRITSKYLVEQQSFFSTSYFTLLLLQDKLLKQPVNNYNRQVEEYSWESIIHVNASERNPREFTLEILNLQDAARFRAMDRAQKANYFANQRSSALFQPIHMVLQCSERDRLITELKHVLYFKHTSGAPIQEKKCSYQSQLDPPPSKFAFQSEPRMSPQLSHSSKIDKLDAIVKLFPTSIQVLQQPQQKDEEIEESKLKFQSKGPDFGTLQFSGIHLDPFIDDQFGTAMISQDEHKKLFQQSIAYQMGEEESEFFDKNENNKSMDNFRSRSSSNRILIEAEEFRTQEKAYEVTIQDSGQEGLPQKLKGRVRRQQCKFLKHFIFFGDIQKVFTQDTTLIFVRKNQEIDVINFSKNESHKSFKKKLEENYSNALKKQLKIQSLKDHFQNNIFFTEPNKSSPCLEVQNLFVIDVVICQIDGQLRSNSKIELSNQFLYEIDRQTNQIRKRCSLVDLDTIRVIDESKQVNLILQFEKSFQSYQTRQNDQSENVIIAINTNSHESRERLISCLLTLRGLQSSTATGMGKIDRLKIFHDCCLDQSQKIISYLPADFGPNYINHLTTDYESNLIRRLSGQMLRSKADQYELYNLTEEILLNATFATLQHNAQLSTQIRAIFKEIQSCLKEYLEYEEDFPYLVEQYLNKSTQKPINLLNYLGKNKQETLSLQASGTEDSQKSILTFQETQERLIRYLNVIKLLLNSKLFFAEMTDHYEIMLNLTKLLISKNSIIALLSSMVLRSTILHFSEAETKLELLNRQVLVRGKRKDQEFAQQAGQIDEFERLEFEQKPKFFDRIFSYFTHFEELFDQSQQHGKPMIKSLHLFSISHVIQPLLKPRRNYLFGGREEEEYIEMFAKRVCQREDAQEEKAIDLPMFQMLDKFSLLDAEYFDIRYQFSSMLVTTIEFYFSRNDEEMLSTMQNYVITYSIQFIWHLYLHMHSAIQEQKDLSCKLVSMLLYKNDACTSLLYRLYPSKLFSNVKQGLEIINSKTGQINTNWNIDNWIWFFSKVTVKNYNDALLQWTDETRKEMMEKLLKEIEGFTQTKKQNLATLSDTSKRDLVLPNHEFDRFHRVSSKQKNLKWNYAEYEIYYDCLKLQFKVGKYFLAKLLNLESLKSGLQFEFTQFKVEQPDVFLNELTTHFMASNDFEEQKIILMAMCVLYSKTFQRIGALKSLPFWLKLIQQEQYKHCHFIILQLVHVVLQISKESKDENKNREQLSERLATLEIAKQNLRKFVKAGGFQVLLNCMNIVFKDLENSNNLNLFKHSLDQDSEQKELLVARKTILSSMVNKKDLEADLDLINFTNSKTNSHYFKRNSRNVSIGILSLKILDLVFRSMQFSDHMPEPSNRKFIFDPKSLSSLTQMLILQNSDLTREVLIFIETHLNSHFAFFKLKNSGMIEFLILCLSTKNGDRALALLFKFQEVCIEFNETLKIGLLNKNDLKMIQEDKNKTFRTKKNEVLLLESIFLRYFPVPFIKFLYEKQQQEFLEVYRSDSYRSPILIWSKQLRQHLEETIQANAKDFVAQIIKFAKNEGNQPQKPPMIKEIVKYDQIEHEVRCGRFYLSVWVEQRQKRGNVEQKDTFFRIPKEEEIEFHNKMQAELRYCIYEDQFKNKTKIITLLKSCLLSLQTFNQKRILCLNEIKRILMHTVKPQSSDQLEGVALEVPESYDEQTKEMVFIGMKIIREAILKEDVNGDNKDNKKEILRMNGVEFISDIVGFILKNSFKTASMGKKLKKQYQEMDVVQEDENEIEQSFTQNNNKTIVKEVMDEAIIIDRMEAKTLNLCVEATTSLVKEDIQSFVDLPLEVRIRIFIQLTQILCLSFSLYSLFKQRTLTQYDFLGNESGSGNYKHGLTFGGGMNISTHIGVNQKKKQKKIKKRKQRKDKADVINQEMKTSDDKNSKKERLKRDPNIDYKKHSLLNIITKQKLDSYSVGLIFKITASVFSLAKEIALYPVLHPDLIASGLAWQAIQHCYFDLTEIRKDSQNLLQTILRDSSQMLNQLISFAEKFTNQGAESFQFTNLILQKEKSILTNFHTCIQNFFTIKMQDKLISEFTVSNGNKLDFPYFKDRESKEFFKLFSTLSCYSPELVWNNETRQEMLASLHEQLQILVLNFGKVIDQDDDSEMSLEQLFSNKILKFNYSVNQKELRVENIFVKFFNQEIEGNQENQKTATYDLKDDSSYTHEKKLKFASSLISKLEEITKLDLVDEKGREDCEQRIEELAKAFKNLIVCQHLTIDERAFKEYFKTICNLIRIKPQLQASKDEIPEKYRARLSRLSKLVLEIIKHIVRQYEDHDNQFEFALEIQQSTANVFGRPSDLEKKKTMCEYLLQSDAFFELMIRVLYQREMEVVKFKEDVLVILNCLIAMKNDQVENLFVNKGLLLFMLNLIFTKEDGKSQIDREIRRNLVEQVLKIEQAVKIYKNDEKYQGVLFAFIPNNFFAEIRDLMRRNQKEKNEIIFEKQFKFLEEFDECDEKKYENVFVKWTKELREKSHTNIKIECEKIIKMKERAPSDRNPIYFPKFKDPELENELLVNDIILRVYNKNPAVFINMKLNPFITDITKQIDLDRQTLYALRMRSEFDNISKLNEKDTFEVQQTLRGQRDYFQYLCYRTKVLLTSLLLSIEQLLYNDFNPNLTKLHREENIQGKAIVYQIVAETIAENKAVEEDVYKYFKVWLQSPVFLDDKISDSIRITFLQVLYLLVEIDETMKYFQKHEVSLSFISDAIGRMSEENGKNTKLIENSLILLIIQGMLKKGNVQQLFKEIFSSLTISQLFTIREKNLPLRGHVEYILYLLYQNQNKQQPEITTAIENINKERKAKQEPEVQQLDLEKYRQYEDKFNKLWRKNPENNITAKAYYKCSSETTFFEKIVFRDLHEKTLSTVKFPLLSEQSIIFCDVVVDPALVESFTHNHEDYYHHQSQDNTESMITYSKPDNTIDQTNEEEKQEIYEDDN